MSSQARILDSIDSVAAEHDAFIVDQWGVLHDGHSLHAGAGEALATLRRHGPVALVSNTSRRIEPARDIVRALGLPDASYDAFITAGELATRWLEDEIARHGRPLRVCTLPGAPGARSLLEGQSVLLTDVSSADAIVVMGITNRAISDWDPVLRAGVDRKLPLLCGNPDIRSIQPDGSFRWCPGAFAARYTQLGGVVHTFGKPRRGIYEAALTALGNPRRVAAFGDSLEHDIVGANRMGFTAVLVTRGIHGPELGLASNSTTDRPQASAVDTLAEQFGARVDAAIATFTCSGDVSHNSSA